MKETVKSSPVNTTVIISLSSRSLLDKWEADYCTWKLNRMIAYEAHVLGMIVLEREEIETRLLFRTERLPDSPKTAKSLLSFPGSQIIASSLVSLVNCLEQNTVFQV